MSREIFEHSRLMVTSYTGPANTLERTRVRLQFSLVMTSDEFTSLGFNDVVALYNALDRWIVEHRDLGPLGEKGNKQS
jgi:hypothetical protein